MKIKVQTAGNFILTVAFAFVLGAGCYYPKAERVPGELVSDVNYKIVDETAVVDNGDNARQWIYVDCDHWAGCFMRCDGESNQCKQLAKDSNFSIVSIFKSVFE